MKYFYLDIEWSQANDEIISIGAFAAPGIGKCRSGFYAEVKPSNPSLIPEKLLELCKMTRKELFHKEDLNVVIERLMDKFKYFQWGTKPVIVVWNREVLKIFWMALKKAGFEFAARHRVVVLQEVLALMDSKNNRPRGFKYYLDAFKIKYSSERLHNARYDAIKLKELYDAAYKICSADDNINSYECVKSVYGSAIHKPDCSCGQKLEKHNLERASRSSIFVTGRTPCRYCFADKKWRNQIFANVNIPYVGICEKTEKKPETKTHNASIKQTICFGESYIAEENMLKAIPDIKQFTDENIGKICRHFSMEYTVAQGVIYIQTKKAKWRIFYNSRFVEEVYHENYNCKLLGPKSSRKDKNKLRSVHAGFHRQDVDFKNLFDVCRYIFLHDNNLFKKPRFRKSKIERLFDVIHNAS